MKIIDSILTDAASIAAIRKDIHAHPELMYEETRTSGVVQRELAAEGDLRKQIDRLLAGRDGLRDAIVGMSSSLKPAPSPRSLPLPCTGPAVRLSLVESSKGDAHGRPSRATR